ncbi:TPA: hypothetical protein DEA21_05685 [Candidatus Uhrbacteria bacterium]|nr:hypothetical protein [Candidatus Uhrbacteria bacterium]
MTVRAAAEITGQKWIPKELVFEIFDCFMSGVTHKPRALQAIESCNSLLLCRRRDGLAYRSRREPMSEDINPATERPDFLSFRELCQIIRRLGLEVKHTPISPDLPTFKLKNLQAKKPETARRLWQNPKGPEKGYKLIRQKILQEVFEARSGQPVSKKQIFEICTAIDPGSDPRTVLARYKKSGHLEQIDRQTWNLTETGRCLAIEGNPHRKPRPFVQRQLVVMARIVKLQPLSVEAVTNVFFEVEPTMEKPVGAIGKLISKGWLEKTPDQKLVVTPAGQKAIETFSAELT